MYGDHSSHCCNGDGHFPRTAPVGCPPGSRFPDPTTDCPELVLSYKTFSLPFAFTISIRIAVPGTQLPNHTPVFQLVSPHIIGAASYHNISYNTTHNMFSSYYSNRPSTIYSKNTKLLYQSCSSIAIKNLIQILTNICLFMLYLLYKIWKYHF